MNHRTDVTTAALMCDDPDQPGAGERRPIPKGIVMPPLPERRPPEGMLKCPKPGVYPSVPFAEYAAWDALNHSRLRAIEDCPEQFKHEEDHPEDEVETASKGFGISTHQAVFEPDLFRKTAIPGPSHEIKDKATGTTRTAMYGRDTKAWEEYAKAHPGKTILGEGELEMIAGICDRLNSDEHIRKLLRHPKALREVAIVWDDEATGDRCKRRIDLAIAEFGWLDLKSTESANPDDFDGAMTNYFYHTADAFTERGVQALKKLGLLDWKEHSVLLAAKKKPPYTAALYTVGPKTMQIARNLVTGWMHKIRECRAAGHFPAYGTGVMELEGREYYLRQFGMSREA